MNPNLRFGNRSGMPCSTSARRLGSRIGKRQPFVRFGKYFSGVLNVKGPLLKGLWIPFAARRGEEIAAVNVDRRGDLIEWVGDGVDGGLTERKCRLEIESLRPQCRQTPFAPSIERVVLAPAVDADD